MQNSPRAQQNSKRGNATESSFPQFAAFDFNALFDMQRPALNALVEFNSKFISGLTNFNEEWVGFVNTRLKEDLNVCKQLAECKSPEEIYSVYNEFYQTALKHYQGEAERMSQIGKTIADDTINTVQDNLEEISNVGNIGNGKRRAA